MTNKESLFTSLHILMPAIPGWQKTLCSLWLYLLILAYLSSRSVKICVNPWLINDLRSTKDYVRKNKLFMQNKAKFQKVKLNVNKVLTKDYDRMDTWSIRITKPIKANKHLVN
jgi:hypothetical protein